ncbi:MAG: beta-glucosidase [Sphingomonas adhaesiva]|uniref:glycoside hydrolase family 3 protein n=1 Tax=Sphingomonas adhaesiva TaxID=28212 RepID=UPI002FF813E1
MTMRIIGMLLAAASTLSITSPTLAQSAPLTGHDAEKRAAAAEAAMTDDERFGLLIGIMPIPIPGLPVDIPAGVPVTAGYVRGVPRLGVPDLLETDGPLGVTNPVQMRKDDTATAMPSALALAAGFDRALAERVGSVMGAEARAKGFNVLLAGGVNLTRDPRGGRNFEYLGEDPLLAGTLGGRVIRGIQSQRVVSTIKHFAINDQETQRHTANAVISEPALRESDLLAFEIGIETGRPASVMCAYNVVNGAPACGSDMLLNRVLKRDWRFPGWVMSDWGSTGSEDDLTAGLDHQSGSQQDRQRWFDGPLRRAVADGRIPRARVGDAVRRILRGVFAVGADQADRPPVDTAANASVALDAARGGIVLLKNDGILPLAVNAKHILVIGGFASQGVLSGGGSSQVTPSGSAPFVIPGGGTGIPAILQRQVYFPSSPVKALQAALPQARIEFASGYSPENAAAAAAHADLVIMFATKWEGEGSDSPSLALPQGQDALIAAVAAANRNAVVVLETGNPVSMPWLGAVRGVVQAWYPGQEGGRAIAEVLTGAVNPSGRLPMTFPATLAHYPRPTLPGLALPERSAVDISYPEGAAVGYRDPVYGDSDALFPFGFGLSYTRFDHGMLRVTGGRAPRVRFTVTNTGDRTGADVPQLYLVARGGKPLKRLLGFDRIVLKPGEVRTVVMTVDPRLLADFNSGGWDVPAGTYALALGRSATDLDPPVTVTLPGRQLAP